MPAFDPLIAVHGARYAIDARFVTRMQHVELRAIEIAFEKAVTADRVGSQHADAANRWKSLSQMCHKRGHEVGDRQRHVRREFLNEGVTEKARQDDRVAPAFLEGANRVEHVNLEWCARRAKRSRSLPRLLLEHEIEW